MHEFFLLVCCPYFNTMKLWTSDPNLHLSLADTTFCLFLCFLPFLLICLLSPLVVCPYPYFYACHIYLACSLFILLLLCSHFPSIACQLVFLFLPFHVHIWSEDAWSWARSPRRKQKGLRCKHANISQAAMFSRFRGLASPIWFCTLLNPLPSSLLSLLDGLY